MYQKWQSYNVWFLRYWTRRTEFFVLFDRFLSFYSLNNLKNQNFEKMKKAPGDIIILYMCTKNYDQIMYCSEIWCATDGRINGRKKWHKEVGAPFKNVRPFKVWLGPLLLIKILLKSTQLLSKHFPSGLSLFLSFISSKGKDTSAIPPPSIQHLVYVFPIFFRFRNFFTETCVSS